MNENVSEGSGISDQDTADVADMLIESGATEDYNPAGGSSAADKAVVDATNYVHDNDDFELADDNPFGAGGKSKRESKSSRAPVEPTADPMDQRAIEFDQLDEMLGTQQNGKTANQRDIDQIMQQLSSEVEASQQAFANGQMTENDYYMRMDRAQQINSELHRAQIELGSQQLYMAQAKQQQQLQFDNAMVESIPGWSNPQARNAIITDSIDFLRSQGMADKDIEALGTASPAHLGFIHQQATAAKRQRETSARRKVQEKLNAKRSRARKAKARHDANRSPLDVDQPYSREEQADAIADLLSKI